MRNHKVCLGLLFLLIVSFGTQAKAAAPAQVTGLKQIDATSSSFQISWQSVEDASFEVLVATSQNGEYEVYQSSSTEQCRVYGRSAGTTYYVKVRACVQEYDEVTQSYESVYAKDSATLAVTTAPAEMSNGIKLVAVGQTNISLTWNAVPGATGYVLEYWPSDGNISASETLSVSKNSANVTGLQKNRRYTFRMVAHREAGGYVARSWYYTSSYYVPTLPTKATGLKCTSYLGNSGVAYVSFDKRESADGYQCQLYEGNKLLTTADATSNSYVRISHSRLKSYRYFRYRVRAYVKVGGKKVYSPWSNWDYISRQPEVKSMKKAGKKLNVKWGKVSGVTSYTVYISTKSGAGYKKVCTTKKTTAAISKYGKSSLKTGKRYYVYIVADKKVGSKIYKSYSNYCWSATYR